MRVEGIGTGKRVEQIYPCKLKRRKAGRQGHDKEEGSKPKQGEKDKDTVTFSEELQKALMKNQGRGEEK